MIPFALDPIDAVADEPSPLLIVARCRIERLLLALRMDSWLRGRRVGGDVEAKKRIRKEVIEGGPRAIPMVS